MSGDVFMYKNEHLMYIILGIAFMLFGFIATAYGATYTVNVGYTDSQPIYENSVSIEQSYSNAYNNVYYSPYYTYSNYNYGYPATYTSYAYWTPTNYYVNAVPAVYSSYYNYYAYNQPYAYGSVIYRYG